MTALLSARHLSTLGICMYCLPGVKTDKAVCGESCPYGFLKRIMRHYKKSSDVSGLFSLLVSEVRILP